VLKFHWNLETSIWLQVSIVTDNMFSIIYGTSGPKFVASRDILDKPSPSNKDAELALGGNEDDDEMSGRERNVWVVDTDAGP
jgi:hypothetical protein